jgi:hypothetical protein
MVMLTALCLAACAGKEEESSEPETLPDDAWRLSEIVIMLEGEGYSPIMEIEFEDGLWEVEAYRGEEFVEIQVDPVTGMITPVEEEE